MASTMLDHQVAQIMSHPVLTIEAGDSLWDAWQMLAVSGFRQLAVLDGDDCIGVISDRAILSHVPATREELDAKRIGSHIAHSPLVSVTPSELITQAAQVMVMNALDAVPVLDRGRLVGIVSASDLVKWAAQRV